VYIDFSELHNVFNTVGDFKKLERKGVVAEACTMTPSV